MRPLIVGEAPSRTSDPRRPLTGRCGERLAALSGVTLDEFRRRTACANLLDRWPGSAGKGARFPMRQARLGADRLTRRFVARERTVVLLGWRVARAFELATTYFEPIRFGRSRIVVVPHPSGVNRWWNDPANARRMAHVMREIVRTP